VACGTKKYYTYIQGRVLEEMNKAVASGFPLSEMSWWPPFWEFPT